MIQAELETPPWMDHAACVGAHPDIFFPSTGLPARQAKAICARCVVRTECLTYALDTYQHHGIWGGLTERERRPLRRQRRLGLTA